MEPRSSSSIESVLLEDAGEHLDESHARLEQGAPANEFVGAHEGDTDSRRQTLLESHGEEGEQGEEAAVEPREVLARRRKVNKWLKGKWAKLAVGGLVVAALAGVLTMTQGRQEAVWFKEDPNEREWVAVDDRALEPAQIVQFEGLHYTERHVRRLQKETVCTNMDEVLESVDFGKPEENPYPTYGYNTEMERLRSCYVVFEDEESRMMNSSARSARGGKIRYRLENGFQHDMEKRNITTLGVGTVFKTHSYGCGACSTLDALGTYLLQPDLTSPVRKCGMRLRQNVALDCLKEIGLRDACGWIWYWNTKNTKESRSGNGCFRTCVAHIWSSNNQPEGSHNPCDPRVCKNRINGDPACSDFQWQNGPYRLNPCLQCDECKSGPIFQKVAGRTRRASGISSAIRRPFGQVSEVYHVYGFNDLWEMKEEQGIVSDKVKK